jgi:hypothetical protein
MEEIDSRIHERVSRSLENANADMVLKAARAEEHMAAAKKIEAETDMLDKDFVRDVTGVNSIEKERDKEHDMIKKIEELNSKERMEFMKAQQNSYISGSTKPTNETNYAQ